MGDTSSTLHVGGIRIEGLVEDGDGDHAVATKPTTTTSTTTASPTAMVATTAAATAMFAGRRCLESHFTVMKVLPKS